jgi:hypothetical protein
MKMTTPTRSATTAVAQATSVATVVFRPGLAAWAGSGSRIPA